MSDAVEIPPVEDAQDATTGEPETFDAQYVAKLRQEAAKYRTEAKKNADAAKRLAEIEEASKTAEQKAAERLAELESKVTEYETREQVAAWKAEVAQATGVPAEALRGSTLEEIQAHGEQLKALIPAEAPKKGAIGPYVPNEGASTSGALAASKGDLFAEAVSPLLPRF